MRPLLALLYNGVRQRGILSPVLFSIYMDDLSILLSQNGIGCHFDDLCIYHVFCVDDLCLMAPSAIALPELINLCYGYSTGINMNFNALKSYCIGFTPKLYKLTLTKRLHFLRFVLHTMMYTQVVGSLSP